MPITSRYQNPYAALGGSAAGIVNSLTNTGAIKGSGYLDASKQMADIDATRAGIRSSDASTQKILDELSRTNQAYAMTPEQLSTGLQGGIGEQFTTMRDFGSSVPSMDNFMKILQGGGQAGGLANIPGLNMDMLKDTLPIGDRAEALIFAMDQAGYNGPEYGMLKAGIRAGDAATTAQAMQLLGAAPMQGIGYMTEPDPNTAMRMLGESVNKAKTAINNPGALPAKQPPGTDYSKLWK